MDIGGTNGRAGRAHCKTTRTVRGQRGPIRPKSEGSTSGGGLAQAHKLAPKLAYPVQPAIFRKFYYSVKNHPGRIPAKGLQTQRTAFVDPLSSARRAPTREL